MNRPIFSLLLALAALAAVTGAATLRGEDGTGAPATESAAPRAVERTTLTCPRPAAAADATTWYTAYTPPGEGGGDTGAAALLPAPEHVPDTEDPDEEGTPEDAGDTEDAEEPEPVAALEEPGRPVAVEVTDPDAPALSGTAEQRLAPGWTVQQTTSVPSGSGRGLLGTSCRPPDTEFWFAGASTAGSRHDYVHITNPDEAATVVDIDLHTAEGKLETAAGQGVTVPGGATVALRLSTLTDDEQPDLAVQVTARTGRVGAQIEAVDEEAGADWLLPAAAPHGLVVLPGIPADATSVRLLAFAPGEEDLSFDVRLAGPNGTIVPAGHETVSVHAGTLTALDLADVSADQPGSLLLTPADGSGAGPLVAALQVTFGEDEERETAFIPATGSIEGRGTVSGNTVSGTELALVAPGEAAEVEITFSGGAEGGEAVTEPYTVDGQTTLVVAPELPDGTEGRYALTVRHTGGGPVHGARTLTTGGGEDDEEDAMYTVQTLPDDRSTVVVPRTEDNLSILTR